MHDLDFDSFDGKVLPPSSFAHVVLRTDSLKTMRDFYVNFLGGRVVYEADHIAFITYDHEHHRIALIQVDGTAKKVATSCGLEHVAYTYSNLSDLLLSYRQRKKLGIEPVWCVNHGPSTSLYYKDPNGNMIETQVDNFDTNEEADRFMKSPEFAMNPLGTDFDPEDLIKRIKAGESEKDIKKRVEIGSRGMDTATMA